MMGRQGGDQASLFYEFRLDDRVPKNHLLRRINVFVTAALADVHDRLDPYYSEIGRPSVDPELMIRMLIVRSAPRPPFGAPTVAAVVRAASPYCQNAAKAQKSTPVRGSSGESRLSNKGRPRSHGRQEHREETNHDKA